MRYAPVFLLALAACVAPTPGGETSPPEPVASPAEAEVEIAWWAVTAAFQGEGHFYTVARNGDTLAAAASSPNLETATLEVLRRGRLPPARVEELLSALGSADWPSISSARTDEWIEEERRLLEVGFGGGGSQRGPWRLPLDLLPPPLSSRIEALAAAASDLAPAPPGGLVRATRIAPDRSEKIRVDPGAPYRFIAVGATDLADAPGMTSALAYPGAVFHVSADEAELLAGWLAASNPRGLGDSLFLAVAVASGTEEVQVHFKRWRTP